MSNHDQDLIEAAMRYLEQVEQGAPPAIDAFVAAMEPAIRSELKAYLEAVLATGDPDEAGGLPAEEERAAQRGRARARARFAARVRHGSPPTGLTEARAARGLTVVSLAQHLNLPAGVVERLEAGGIRPATIPERLIQRLATLLERSELDVRRLLDAGPATPGLAIRETPAGYSVQADGSEPPGATSFAEALWSARPTAGQMAEWGEEF